MVVKPKALRPERMRPYKGESVGEHIHWFREVKIKFLMSPEYFTTNAAKIIYCMQSLEGDAGTQWYRHFETRGLGDTTFPGFEEFLLNLVADPANRRLRAYEKWESAKQGATQKVTAFKGYLEELEAHLPPFSEEHRVNIFLSKLNSDLKNKLLSTGNVPKQREELLAQALMQEQVLERSRRNSGMGQNGSGSQSRQSGGTKQSGGSKENKSLESRISHPKANEKGSDKEAVPQTIAPKRKNENEPGHDHKRDSNYTPTCYHCGEEGHISRYCPRKDKPKTYQVGAVSAKKEIAPTEPRQTGYVTEI